MMNSDKWPEVDPIVSKEIVRIGSAFRELAANRNISHEQLGRITRCLILDTDAFMDVAIEPIVYELRREEERREYNRGRMKKSRQKKRMREQVINKMEVDGPDVVEIDTLEDESSFAHASKSEQRKDTFKDTQKTPPIIPLENPLESPLERMTAEIPVQGSDKPRRRKKGERLQQLKKRESKVVQGMFDIALGGSEDRLLGYNHPCIAPQECHVGGANEPVSDSSSCSVERPEAEKRTQPRAVSSPITWIAPYFERFWKAYPKRKAKADAMKALVKVMKKQEDPDKFMEILLKSVEDHKRHEDWKKDNGRYVPYPATYLNRGCWEDELVGYGPQESFGEFLKTEDSGESLIARMKG